MRMLQFSQAIDPCCLNFVRFKLRYVALFIVGIKLKPYQGLVDACFVGLVLIEKRKTLIVAMYK
jgi:hypothetical protein